MKRLLIAALPLVFAGAAHAEGDPAKGEREFNKCKACHMIVDDAGGEIVKGGKVGPNLYGIIGRQAGTVEGFKYGASLAAAGQGGLVWDQANMVEYLKDPKAFLVAATGDEKAKSNMAFKLSKGGEDVAAYLAQHDGQ